MTEAIETLIEQRSDLNKKIEEAQKTARKEALKSIKELMYKHSISIGEITRKGNGLGIKVPPKFQDPISGAVWTGRGKAPKWFNPTTAIKL